VKQLTCHEKSVIQSVCVSYMYIEDLTTCLSICVIRRFSFTALSVIWH